MAASAQAHPEFNQTRTNRYVKLSLVGGGSVRVAYTVLIGELPAAAQRKAADVNADGTIDAAHAGIARIRSQTQLAFAFMGQTGLSL